MGTKCCNASHFKKLDFFKFEGRPKHIIGHQASVTGVVGTILLLLIIAGYMGNSTFRFFSDPPATSVTQSPTMGEKHPMVPTCMILPHINDPKYFFTRLQLVELDDRGGKLNETDVQLRQHNDSMVCIDPSHDKSAFLRSFCSPGNCHYLKWKLWTCGCPDKNNPDKGRNDCASWGDIVEVLQTHYVDVEYTTPLGLVVLHTAPKPNASALYSSSFNLNETRINPDLVRSFETHHQHNLVHDRDTYAIQYFFEGGEPVDVKKEVLELRIIMSAHVLLTVENRMTILDLFGQWGALFNVIASALALVFLKYNENKFYEQNPKWERIDADFNVEEGSEHTLAAEAEKLIGGGGGGAAGSSGALLDDGDTSRLLAASRSSPSARSPYGSTMVVNNSNDRPQAASYGGVLT